MNCPVCSALMKEKDFGGVKVDVCEDGCKGLWFDWVELGKLDEQNEGCGAALQAALAYPRVNDEGRGPLKCPKCQAPMHTHTYASSKETNVDECYVCGGFFLDSGELKQIRDTFMTDEESRAYVAKIVADVPVYNEKIRDMQRIELRKYAAGTLGKQLRKLLYA